MTFRDWFFQGMRQIPEGPHAAPAHQAPWWKVMCLTGVDYFSTLAYQPGIAFAAAGLLSPLATLVLVLLTLVGALPMYYRVAEASPHGQGSILMLESLFPRWKGKAVVLVLLGFAATSFVITITLSAADATAHLIENPLVPGWMDHPILVTLGLLFVLGAVFMRGFSEVIGIAVVIVAIYLVLNAIVVAKAMTVIWAHPELLPAWRTALSAQHASPLGMIAAALIVFPKLALGLSGFETGVAVMPLVKGDPGDTEANPAGRIRNTKKLLLVAALLMSVLLMASSVVTTVLIPGALLLPGGPAAGRALAYLAHEQLGTAIRHRVRRGDRRHAVVRRSLSARGAAQPGSAVPAALRHGTRMGPRQSAAHRDLHVDHVCRHARLPTRTSRRRAAHTRRAYWS